MKRRFVDEGQRIYDFVGEMLVRCPRCEKCAEVLNWPSDHQVTFPAYIMFAPKRLACRHCGYVKDTEKGLSAPNRTWASLHDPYFDAPLWLQTSCCGEVLWAYNREHLDALEDFVGAELRDAYPNGTMASRLPAWLKSAKNREDVLKGIRKLREMIE